MRSKFNSCMYSGLKSSRVYDPSASLLSCSSPLGTWKTWWKLQTQRFISEINLYSVCVCEFNTALKFSKTGWTYSLPFFPSRLGRGPGRLQVRMKFRLELKFWAGVFRQGSSCSRDAWQNSEHIKVLSTHPALTRIKDQLTQRSVCWGSSSDQPASHGSSPQMYADSFSWLCINMSRDCSVKKKGLKHLLLKATEQVRYLRGSIWEKFPPVMVIFTPSSLSCLFLSRSCRRSPGAGTCSFLCD